MNKTDRRNTDTSAANKKRTQIADEFALEIVDKLDQIEKINGFKFEKLLDRAIALNHLAVKTSRGKNWSKASVFRILKRVENLKY